jgi:hypothetical protein
MRRSLVLASCLALATASGAFAAPDCSALLSQGCACVSAISKPGDVIGQLRVTGGDVRKTGAGDYTPLAPRTLEHLSVGDGVIVGDKGEAYLTAGLNCKERKLEPQTSVVVDDVNGCACVAIVGSEGIAPLETGSTNGNGRGAAIAATIAVGGGVYLLLKNSVSP